MPEQELLSKAKASEYIDMPQSFLESSGEVPAIKTQMGSRQRVRFNKTDLDAWIKNRATKIELLEKEDYAKCFDFALAMHYRGYTAADWGTGRKRELGQNLTNWIRGQLGEIAVQKFILKHFKVLVELDFELHEEIVPQDIIGVKTQSGKRDPKLKIGIKATKFRNSFLVLGAADVEPDNRRSDIYVLTRINLPDDHLMRIAKTELEELLKHQKYFSSYKGQMHDFEPVPCEVVGFIKVEELDKVSDSAQLAKILGTRNPEGYRYVKPSGSLHYSSSAWSNLVAKL